MTQHNKWPYVVLEQPHLPFSFSKPTSNRNTDSRGRFWKPFIYTSWLREVCVCVATSFSYWYWSLSFKTNKLQGELVLRQVTHFAKKLLPSKLTYPNSYLSWVNFTNKLYLIKKNSFWFQTNYINHLIVTIKPNQLHVSPNRMTIIKTHPSHINLVPHFQKNMLSQSSRLIY